MSIEKEVILRLRVPKEGRDGKAFEEVAANARKLEKDAQRAGGAVAAMLREMNHVQRISKSLRELGVEAKAAGDAAVQMLQRVGDGAKITAREIQKTAVALRALGHEAKAAVEGTGPASKGPTSAGQLRSLGGLLNYKSGAGGVTAVAGLANTGVGLAEAASSPEEGLTFRRFKEQAIRRSMDIPLFGNFLGQSNEAQELKERDRRIADARARIGRTEQRAAVLGAFASQQRSLGEQQLAARGLLIDQRAGRDEFAASRESRIASDLAQDRARREGRNPAEVAAQFAHAQAVQSLGIGQAAEREKLAKTTEFRQGQVGNARTELAAARREAATLSNASQGETADQALERRLNLERALVEVKAKENQLAETESALLDAHKEKAAQLLQQSRERAQVLGQERDRLQQVVQSEKDRLTAQGRAFGRMSRPEQLRAAQLAEQAAWGGKLTREQLDFLRATPGSEKLVAKQEDMRIDQEALRRFRAAGGAEEPLKNAQERLTQIENKISLELKVNGESLASELQKTLLPAVEQMMADLKEGLLTSLQRQSNQRKIQEGTLGQQGGAP